MLEGDLGPDREQTGEMDDNARGSRSFPATTDRLHAIRAFVRDETERAQLPPDVVRDMVLAVSEACANSALHSESEDVRVRLTITGNRVEACVEDSGVFSRRMPTPEIGTRGGRGIPLMMAVVDEFAIQEGHEDAPGTVVRLVKYAA